MIFLSRKIHNFLSEKTHFLKIFSIFTFILLSKQESFAWGGRGHDTICEAASFLVQEKELKKFLQTRTHIMGHLCNIPDIQWRSESGDVRSAGDPTHFIDPEIIGYTVKNVPLDLEKLKKDFTGKPSQLDKEEKIYSVPRQLGSVYWRVDQLMRILNNLQKDFADAKVPANKSEEQNNELPFNKATYTFMTTAGVMGHFVADAAQPYHTTSDYDGWDSGHGGIHAYYEDALVSHIDGELLTRIMKQARTLKHPDWTKGTYVERMRSYTIAAYNDIEKIKKLDPIIKKSEVKLEKGMKLKTPATRKDASEALKKFEPLITTHMARAAWMLAQLWDEAYRNAGKPQLSSYKSYKFPFNVDFIYPDYDDKTSATPEVKK